MKTIGKSLVTMAFAALTALPAAAQGGVRVEMPFPSLEIRVGHSAPPKPRSEHKSHRPGPDYTWNKGSWDWQGNNWMWLPGRWDRPSEHGARWVHARYAQEGHGWRYEPSHWSNQQIVEGDDYRRWKHDQHRDHDHDHDGDHDRNHELDRDSNHH